MARVGPEVHFCQAQERGKGSWSASTENCRNYCRQLAGPGGGVRFPAFLCSPAASSSSQRLAAAPEAWVWGSRGTGIPGQASGNEPRTQRLSGPSGCNRPAQAETQFGLQKVIKGTRLLHIALHNSGRDSAAVRHFSRSAERSNKAGGWGQTAPLPLPRCTPLQCGVPS